ncbi:hypothetical protein GCK32_020857, partial [Trichostrongylus colubriformis]
PFEVEGIFTPGCSGGLSTSLSLSQSSLYEKIDGGINKMLQHTDEELSFKNDARSGGDDDMDEEDDCDSDYDAKSGCRSQSFPEL